VAPTATRRLLEHVASTLPGAPVDDAGLAALSDREREILLEVARGRSNAEIAAALHIAEPTVKTTSAGCARSSACTTGSSW
jgi:DNA-binding NarL/FixJ family response regulator